MGPIGVQEMVIIFLVALVLFGPRKLPELGKTIAKAVTEFRRAQSDLKATFEREMAAIERENESLKEVTRQTAVDLSSYSDIDLVGGHSGANPPQALDSGASSGTSSYGASEYIAGHPMPQEMESAHVAETPSSTVSASAVPGAELPGDLPSYGSSEAGSGSSNEFSWDSAPAPKAPPVIKPVAAQGVVARGSRIVEEPVAVASHVKPSADDLPSFGAPKASGKHASDDELPGLG